MNLKVCFVVIWISSGFPHENECNEFLCGKLLQYITHKCNACHIKDGNCAFICFRAALCLTFPELTGNGPLQVLFQMYPASPSYSSNLLEVLTGIKMNVDQVLQKEDLTIANIFGLRSVECHRAATGVSDCEDIEEINFAPVLFFTGQFSNDCYIQVEPFSRIFNFFISVI